MNSEVLKYFELSGTEAATVSEISEAVAASNVPPEERVNLHIGNPIQHKELQSLFLKLTLQIPLNFNCDIDNAANYIKEYNLSNEEVRDLELIKKLIIKCSPYAPRGGFLKTNPNFAARYFYEWLTKNQVESLNYDLGEKSGVKEISIISGGIFEALRILFFALNEKLKYKPAKILFYDYRYPVDFFKFDHLYFEFSFNDEEDLEKKIIKYFENNTNALFVIFGSILKEETRRKLRVLSLRFPIFFVEVNDAPNHYSLARESKMMRRVLRFLTCGIFDSSLKNYSVVFAAGNAEYIKAIENFHFQLKGTPSVAEMEGLQYLIENNLIVKDKRIEVRECFDEYFSFEKFNNARLFKIIERWKSFSEKRFKRIESLVDFSLQSSSLLKRKLVGSNALREKNSFELLTEITNRIDDVNFCDDLIENFLTSYCEYNENLDISRSCVVSGSSRTALSLLGFHCDIKEAIAPDLSWTYEHCFPKVFSSALTDDFELNVPELKKIIDERVDAKQNSPDDYQIALVLNNPHNATGMIFNEKDVEELIKYALRKKIYVIDDLSYSNVAPSKNLNRIKTVKDITIELCKKREIILDEFNRAITVQSVSKTDCLAGSRLAIVEIPEEKLYNKYKKIVSYIKPNLFAIFLSYLFYRNSKERVEAYYLHRNKLFYERTKILTDSVEAFPSERNAYQIKILPPKGAMYPILKIELLPDGVSLENLAYNLARGGVGVVPLSAFARTSRGYEIARSCFRLTLGGTDDNETLRKKARRLLIDLNRIIAELKSHYKIEEPNYKNISESILSEFNFEKEYNDVVKRIDYYVEDIFQNKASKFFKLKKNCGAIKNYFIEFKEAELAFRKSFIRSKLRDYSIIFSLSKKRFESAEILSKKLREEFSNDCLKEKIERFKYRQFDRTVHPTQARSIEAEKRSLEIVESIARRENISDDLIRQFCESVVDEYLSTNVSIKSEQEGYEAILDLKAATLAESFFELNDIDYPKFILSFWGDWDGSSRPSGQGQSIAAKITIENIRNQIKIITAMQNIDRTFSIDKNLKKEILRLEKRVDSFLNLLDRITKLTDILEKQYKSYLPIDLRKKNIISKLFRVQREDPESVFKRNLRLEKRMLKLRKKRREELEYYFYLNQRLRDLLFENVEKIVKNINNYKLFVEIALFKNYLSRFVISPRIHQKMVLGQDQFPIDTTVENIFELNSIGAKYGNPGLIFLAQISMSTKPEAAIAFERKLRLKREDLLRNNPNIEIPIVTIAPLFEDFTAVRNLNEYLEKIYERASQTKRIDQKIEDRFGEIISEIFIAGSDLSQQVGQPLGLVLYKEAKLNLYQFLSFKNLLTKVRIKLGSGEPMQRQGNYYSFSSGKKLFVERFAKENCKDLKLTPTAFKSAEYATTPLLGVFLNADLKTFQSYISEQVRSLSVEKYANLLWYLRQKQMEHLQELQRAGEPLTETRLQFKTRGIQELERLTAGKKDAVYERFLEEHKNNFRQITYGKEEDVVGLHIVSYFIGRSLPQLRDRPTARLSQSIGSDAIGRKIIERIAKQIPLSKSGSLLRAISHNQSQTMILGIPQLALGLSRTINSFLLTESALGDAEIALYERILPNLPVYEILYELRIYCEKPNGYIEKIEKAFPPGNSSLYALGEDISFLNSSIKLFQKELIRRHGLNVSDFFENDEFNPELYRFLRPDIAVIMQKNLFNDDFDSFYREALFKINNEQLKRIKKIFEIRNRTAYLRSKIWEIIEEPIISRVKSFCDLALALWELTSKNEKLDFSLDIKKANLKNQKAFSMAADENMRQFFADAFKYLNYVYETSAEMPIQVAKALKEAEKLIKLDQMPINEEKQNFLRYYLIQMGRLTGFNG